MLGAWSNLASLGLLLDEHRRRVLKSQERLGLSHRHLSDLRAMSFRTTRLLEEADRVLKRASRGLP